MFSKILDNIRGDFSKSNNNFNMNDYNNYNKSNSIQERAKSSLNRKNNFSTKYSLPEMKEINNKNQTNNKLINKKNTLFNHTNFYNSNKEANNKETHLFMYNNNNSKADLNNPYSNNNHINNSYNNYKNCNSNLIQQEFNTKIKKSEKFDINNFKLSNDDFQYSNNFDNMKIDVKSTEKKIIASEKTQKFFNIDDNNNDNNYNSNNHDSDYHVDTEKFDPKKLIDDYRLQLNKELLRRLYEEREKEHIRDKILANSRDHSEQRKIEQRFIFERAQASSDIIKINE